MRLLLRLALALGVAALLALAAVWWRLDALAERAVERGASGQLGVATEIESLLLRPISGILSLRGLSIANPPARWRAACSRGSASPAPRSSCARRSLDAAQGALRELLGPR